MKSVDFRSRVGVAFIFLVTAFVMPGTSAISESASAATKVKAPVIVSLTPNTGVPMSTLHIRVNNLRSNHVILVTFAGFDHFLVKQAPQTVTKSSIDVTVPLFINESTGAPSTGVVSVTVTQSGRHSKPVALTIQAIASDSTFGLPVGQISDTFFNYSSMVLAQKINELQAFQAVTGTDETSAVQNIQTLQHSYVLARYDVDQIMADSSVQIPAGTLPNGNPLVYDVSTVAMMDTVFATYMLQLFSTSPIVAAAVSRVRSHSQTPQVSMLEAVQSLVKAENNVTSEQALVKDAQENPDAISATVDALSFGSAASDTFEAVSGSPIAQELSSPLLGVVLASVTAAQTGWATLSDGYQYFSNANSDSSAAAVALQNLQTDGLKFSKSLAAAGCSYATLDPVTALVGYGCLAVLGAAEIAANLPGSQLQSISLLNNSVQPPDVADPEIFTSSQNIPTSPAQEGYAILSGIANVTNTNALPPPLSVVQGCCVGGSNLAVGTMADSSGNYNLIFPVGVPGTTYSAINLSVVDPLSGVTLGSEYLNLSQALPGVIDLPAVIFGTCNDADRGATDNDDPDCD